MMFYIAILLMLGLPIAYFAIVLLTEHVRLTNAEPSRWDGRYISDEEFLAACAPGVRPEVAFRVRAIIAEQFGLAENELHPSHRFVEDLGA